MAVVKILSAQWANAEKTHVVGTADIEGYNGVWPFAVFDGYDTELGQEIWDAVTDPDFDGVAVYTPPTPEQERAAMPPLQKWRVDTIIDLEPGLRDRINTAIEAMSEPDRTISRNKLASVTEFYRIDPLFDLIGTDPTIGKTPDDIDAMWSAALALK